MLRKTVLGLVMLGTLVMASGTASAHPRYRGGPRQFYGYRGGYGPRVIVPPRPAYAYPRVGGYGYGVRPGYGYGPAYGYPAPGFGVMAPGFGVYIR